MSSLLNSSGTLSKIPLEHKARLVLPEIRAKCDRLVSRGHAPDDALSALHKCRGDEAKAQAMLEAALTALWAQSRGVEPHAAATALQMASGHVARAWQLLVRYLLTCPSSIHTANRRRRPAIRIFWKDLFFGFFFSFFFLFFFFSSPLPLSSHPQIIQKKESGYSELPLLGTGTGSPNDDPMPDIHHVLPRSTMFAADDPNYCALPGVAGMRRPHPAEETPYSGMPSMASMHTHDAAAAAAANFSANNNNNNVSPDSNYQPLPGMHSGKDLPDNPNYADGQVLLRNGSSPMMIGSPPLQSTSSSPSPPGVSAQRQATPFRRGAPASISSPALDQRSSAGSSSSTGMTSSVPAAISENRAASTRVSRAPAVVDTPVSAYRTVQNPLAASNATELGRLIDDESLCQSCGVEPGVSWMAPAKGGSQAKLLCQQCILVNLSQSPMRKPPLASSSVSPVNTPPAKQALTVCEWCLGAPSTGKVMFEDGRHPLHTCTSCNILLTDNPDAPRPGAASLAPPPRTLRKTSSPPLAASPMAQQPQFASPPASSPAAAPRKVAREMCEHCRLQPVVAKVLFEDGRTKKTCEACTRLLNDDPDAPPMRPMAQSAPAPASFLPVIRDAQGNIVTSAVSEDAPAPAAVPIDLKLRALGPHAATNPTPKIYCDADTDLTRYDWFHGLLQQEEADAVLANVAPGTFLVRVRPSQPDFFVLVWKEASKAKVTHILVSPVVDATDKRFQVQAVDNSYIQYASLLSVVRAYTKRHMRTFFKATTSLPHDAQLMKLRRARGDDDY